MLGSFLKDLHVSLNECSAPKYTVVTGNQACDLDSIACAVSYAYIKSKEDPDSGTVYVPYCNIPDCDLDLRTEVSYWLGVCNIDKTDLFYSGSLECLLKPTTTKEIGVILVDHAQQEPNNTFNTCPVQEIIDHHPLLPGYKQPDTCAYFLVEQVGSCASLIALELFKRVSRELIPPELCQLLYGAIVIDNAGLSDLAKQLQKATPKDLEAADKLEGFMKSAAVTGVSTREAVYEQIKEAKFSIKGLSLWDLLRRDFKRVNADSEHQLEIVCSTITGMDFVELIAHRDFGQVTRRFCEEHSAQILVCITVGNVSVTSSDTSVTSAIRLGLVVTALHDHRNLAENLWHHLMAAKVLRLEPPSKESKPSGGADASVFAATITNKTVTRKQVIPILIEFLRAKR